MKTAIEWFVEQLTIIQQEGLRDIIEQAKEMEKNQIIDAYLKDRQKSTIDKVLLYLDNAEQYFNETYKSE
jgi:hypothetical protein